MADETGHGIGPALSVTQLRSMTRMAVRLRSELPAILQVANRELCADLPPGRFITAWAGELDDERRELKSLSAGQAPLLRFHAERDEFEVHDASTVPLGVLEEIDPGPTPCFAMKPGDFFAVISDGIFEATNKEGDAFGVQRVQQCLRQSRLRGAEAMIDAIRQSLHDYTNAAELTDDRTAIIVLCRAAGASS
jgi:phosphoserine phosphatase